MRKFDLLNMENVPLTPPKKNKKGKVIHSGQRMMIVNIYKDKKNLFPEMKYIDLMQLVANTCGVGRRTVIETIAEYKRTSDVKSPRTKRSKPDMVEKLTEEGLERIQRHVHSFLDREEVPTIAKVFELVRGDENLPTMSKSTLHRVLKKMKLL